MIFVRSYNPIWYFVDQTGEPLNDEYYAFFLTNEFPYVPQAVYRDNQGTATWPAALELLANGTLPENLFFDPTKVYRIEIRHGNTQADPLIDEVNNYVPGNETSTSTFNEIQVADNLISNPQFSEISFSSPFTYTQGLSGDYIVPVAPGWDLYLTGQGTTVLTQLLFSGSDDIQGNPPYALRINNTGWTEASLRQRFTRNGAIFANGAISMSITARAHTDPQDITLSYMPSQGAAEPIASDSIAVGVFQVLAGVINVGASTNPDLGDDAYVDMIIQLEPTGTIDLTNIQVVGQSDELTADQLVDPVNIPSFIQETTERTVDHLFHYYSDQLITKPKNTILTGWNFSLNPWQFSTTVRTTIVPVVSYTADQTILYQDAASSLAVGQADAIARFGYGINAVTAATPSRFAIIQYIDPLTILPYWDSILSCLTSVREFSMDDTTLRIKARLIWRTTLPSTIGAAEPIASWSGTDPVFSAGWTAILPVNDPEYTLSNSEFNSVAFDGFQMPVCSTTTMTLGIVIYCIDTLVSTAGHEDGVVFDKISLVPNEFAVESPPETYNQSLRKCQFYYEKSYVQSLVTTVTPTGQMYAQQLAADNGGSNTAARPKSFQLVFKEFKRLAPVVTFYSPSAGTINEVDIYLINGGAAASNAPVGFNPNWVLGAATNQYAAYYVPNSFTALVNPAVVAVVPESYILFHYTADSRLGI